MKHILLLLGLIITFSSLGWSQSDNNNQPQISLITCGPDDSDPATLFGHTAVRLYDPSRNIDVVYNYGIYDFTAPNFLVNFFKGNTQYYVARYPYANFLQSYHRDNRWVKEQVFDLDSVQIYSIVDFLNNNIQPENSTYLYNFFYDNCSTRVKDLLENLLPNYDYVDAPIKMTTYRQLLDEYLVGLDWTDFGIDIVIGSPGDEVIDHHGQMFLPEYLMTYADRFKDENGKPLVSETYDVLPLSKPAPQSFWITPFVLFGVLLFLELILFIKRKDWNSVWVRVYDISWYLVVSLAAALLLFMMTTLHTACHANYNLLWLSPLFIPFTYFFIRRKGTMVKYLGLAIIAFFVVTIAGAGWIPQVFPAAGLLVIGILVLKILRNIGAFKSH